MQISQKRYFHPDITVTCDPRDRGTGDLFKSPRVIFEASLQALKFQIGRGNSKIISHFQRWKNTSLSISKSLKMEIYCKEHGRWMYDIYQAHEMVTLSSLDVGFPLTDAYLDVEIEETSLEEESDHETH